MGLGNASLDYEIAEASTQQRFSAVQQVVLKMLRTRNDCAEFVSP